MIFDTGYSGSHSAIQLKITGIKGKINDTSLPAIFFSTILKVNQSRISEAVIITAPPNFR